MKPMKPTVYIETSVISYYAARLSRDLIVAAHQQITQEWWDKVLPKCKAYVSPVVTGEIALGDAQAAARRAEVAAAFDVLEIGPEIMEIAELYRRRIDIPDAARGDAYHLAVASWHHLDFLLTWNCRHMAAPRVREALSLVNDGLGIPTPAICTPEELMEL